jgi:uncharacterized membrane protein
MKRLILAIVNMLVLFLLVIFIIIALWRFNILKLESETTEKIKISKEKEEFIKKYPYSEMLKFLSNLPNQKIELPKIQNEEIGRSSLF